MLLVAAGLLSASLSMLSSGGKPVVQPDGASDLELPSEPVVTLRDALKNGETWVKLRYRFENVDQGGFASDAHASTLRTLLGYRTARYGKFQGLIEFEDVSVVGDRAYNSTTNMMTGRPIVPDPEGGEVNQVYGSYHHDENSEARIGRQQIVLDNRRFIGDRPWRQNQQTFDAVTWNAKQVAGTVDVFYGFISNTNLPFSDPSPAGDQRMATHLLNLSHEIEGWGRGSVYAYHFDFDSLDTLSNSTFGGRFEGKRAFDDFDLLYLGELATQSDAGDNPTDYSAGYFHTSLGAKVSDNTIKVGLEVMDGSGTPGHQFITPLANRHGPNGLADQFVNTPNTGLEDLNLSAQTVVRGVNLTAAYHDFGAESGGMDYGSEYDLVATYPIDEDLTVGIKLADYDADSFSTDVTKAWFWIDFAF